MITIAQNWVALLLTVLIPLFVAAVTKSTLPTRWKSVITIIISAAIVLIHRSTTDGLTVVSAQAAFDWAVTTAVAVFSYLGFWQPVVDVNKNVAPDKGLG